MIYHVSSISGIKVLTPKVSTHKKPYVYAIENMVTGVLFGVKQDDFDFIISTDENDTPEIYECYPNAVSLKYEGKKCSVYSVKEEGFLHGMTSWSSELVSENEVEVIEELVISDIYQFLLEEEAKHHISIRRYEDNDEYKGIISKHIVDRLIRFNIDLDNCRKHDERFAKYYSYIIQELLKIMDGHLLCPKNAL